MKTHPLCPSLCLLSLAAVGLTSAGCGPGSAGDAVAALESVSAHAIVNGELDTTHDAVVAYITGGSKCTATIFHRAGNTGYALTAAHCIGGQLGELREGLNHANGQFDRQYSVTATTVHPEYTASGLFDVAVLTFSGADANTPVIAPLPVDLDALSTSDALDVVGYGQTADGANTLRQHLLMSPNVLTALRVGFDQTAGGICAGDSGAPAILTIDDVEYVAATGSFLGIDCTSASTFIRTSAIVDAFLLPVVNNTPVLDPTCAQCEDAHVIDGECTTAVIACFDDGACSAYLSCVEACDSQACEDQCAADHSDGVTLYDALETCVCDGVCAGVCADDSGETLCLPPWPEPDAGVLDDAGVDAGVDADGGTSADAGGPDDSGVIDAGDGDGDGGGDPEDGGIEEAPPDGGVADAGSSTDSGVEDAGDGDGDGGDGDDGGCTCSDTRGPGHANAALVGLCALALIRRPRRSLTP